MLTCVDADTYRLSVPVAQAGIVGTWLRDLSDGYVSFNLNGKPDFDPRREPGPVIVSDSKKKPAVVKGAARQREQALVHRPAGPGSRAGTDRTQRCRLPMDRDREGEAKFTALHETHKSLGAKMVPFAGWDMPVWYTSVVEEHLATRQAAGLFDVSHMGVYDVRGADAASFLDTVCGNDCGGLLPGESPVLRISSRPRRTWWTTRSSIAAARRLSGGGQRLQR